MRLLRDSWVSALRQILFNIYIKDPGTRKERPPTLLVCVITAEDTRKNWTPKGLVHLKKNTKFNSTLCKLTYFGKVYSDYLLSTESCLRTTKAERCLAMITDDSYQCEPVMTESNTILRSIKTDEH